MHWAYNESEDVGLYCAHMKHYLLTTCWQLATKSGRPLWPTYPKDPGFRPIRIGGNGVDLGTTGTAWATELDQIVYQSEHPLTLLQGLQSFQLNPPYPFWRAWSDIIYDDLADLAQLSLGMQRHYLWADLWYAYVEECERLFHRIGPKEMRARMGLPRVRAADSDDSGILPAPVQRISGMPIWTEGQADVAGWQQQGSNDPPEWSQRRQHYRDSRTLVLEPDDLDADPPEYRFYSNSFHYTMMNVGLLDSLQISDASVFRLAQFIRKRVAVEPKVDLYLGRRALRKGDLRQARPLLENAVRSYLTCLPADFDGVIDGESEDSFPYALAHLAYVRYAEGRRAAAHAWFELADRLFPEDTVGVLSAHDIFDQYPDDFGRWFRQEYLQEDYPLIAPLQF